jgi:hypothetical protein
MTRWQKIGLAISILWLIGLSIFLVVHSTWKTVVNILVAGNLDTLTLWAVMLGPVVILWSIGIVTAEVVRWIRQRQTTAEQDGEGPEERSQAGHGIQREQ